MQAKDLELLTGSLALAYKYCGLAALRQGYAALEEAGNSLDLARALQDQGAVDADRGDRLRRGARLAERLRTDAIYGMITLRNRLVGGQILNACMEESRRSGYEKTLSQVLIERGVLTDTLHKAIDGLRAQVTPELFAKERALAAAIDLARDDEEMAELKLAVLLGEVSAKISFLNKEDLDAALCAQEAISRGVAPEAATRRAPLQAPPPTPPIGPPPPQPAAAGTVAASSEDAIKGYELLEKLGAGAMGAVLKARKRDNGEVVALKILKPELAADREYVERFLREAKAVARLSHMNIIRAVQVGKSGDYYFFAMEFVEGRTVSEMIKGSGPLDEQSAIRIVRCIASALGHAWQHQIVHRDIKPDNIMVADSGDVKLTDLGLARTAKQDSTLTITGVVMGSPAYISPEQATGEKNLDIRSDIYSLGATLYHMLTGVVPYDGETPLHVMLKHMNDPLPDVRKVLPSVSEATRLLIFRMMAKRPQGRLQRAAHVEAVAKGIEDALSKGLVPPIPQGLAPPKPKPRPSSTDSGPGGVVGTKSGRRKSLRASQSGEGRISLSGEGKSKKDKSKQREIGKRLRRMAAKRKRRF